MTTTLDASGTPARSLLPFLDREHTIARPGYSRWMVPVQPFGGRDEIAGGDHGQECTRELGIQDAGLTHR